MTTTQNRATDFHYGCERFGRLTRVMLHRPGEELRLINKENHAAWLFDEVPDVDRFVEEHDAYSELLQEHGVQVHYLSAHVEDVDRKARRMPNLAYLHDVAVVSSRGAILSAMAWAARRNEHLLVREALDDLGVPILYEFDEPDDAFEGCLQVSPEILLIAETERHSRRSIRKFIPEALNAYKQVLHVIVPRARRYMHPDTIFNRVDVGLALAYLPAFKQTFLHTGGGCCEVDVEHYLRSRGIRVINVSEEEQRRLACTFVPLEPGVMLHYDTALSERTKVKLARRGVELILFHPEAMIAGGGSLRCLTLRMHRDA